MIPGLGLMLLGTGLASAAIGTVYLHLQRARHAGGLPSLHPMVALRTLAGEALAHAAFGWWHLRALGRGAMRRPRQTNGRPVLCVHGYTQNSTNFWGLRQALEAAGRPTMAVFLGLAWPWRRLEGYTLALERALEDLSDEPDGVDVVAHSMGGLVLRIVLAKRPDLAGRLRRVVTVGTPHGGTALARVSAFRPLDQLRHGAAYLRTLPSLQALLPQATLTTVGSESDMVVYPVQTAFQEGSQQIRFRHAGHIGLMVHTKCINAMVAALTGG